MPQTDIVSFSGQQKIEESFFDNIKIRPLDDPEHHSKMFEKVMDGVTSDANVVYDPEVTFTPFTLTKDAVWYVKTKQSHYHVYLHYWNDTTGTTVYNPNDYYPTFEYDPSTGGFSQRGAPRDETNYDFIGWQLTDSPTPTAKEELDCLYGVGKEARPDKNGNEWPVIPDKVKISGTVQDAQDWHLHPIYKLAKVTFNFYDQGSETKVKDTVETKPEAMDRKITDPEKDHHSFVKWVYKNEVKLIDSTQQEVTRKAGEEVVDGDFNAEFLSPFVNVEAQWDKTYNMATFYMDDDSTEDSSRKIWVPISTSATHTSVITEDYLPKDTPTEPENTKFIGWSKTKLDSRVRSEVKNQLVSFAGGYDITDDTTKFYPVYVNTDYEITVGFLEGQWTNGTDIKPASTVKFGVWEDVDYTSDMLTSEIHKAAELDDTWYLVGTNPTKPNFAGWCVNTSSDIVRTSVRFTNNSNLWAIYAVVGQVTVTFSSNSGDFTYTDLKTSENVTLSAISYELNVEDYKSQYGHYPTIMEVYELATKASSEHSLIELSRDGFKQNEYTDVDGVKYPGWLSQSASIPETFPIQEGAYAFYADWKEKTHTTWAEDDWGTVIRYANQGEDVFKETYLDAYQSTSKDGNKSHDSNQNKAKNTFIGLEKEIKLPSLNETYRTRVVGYNQDTLSDESANALLTFDFVECPISVSTGRDNDYVNGYINKTFAGLIRGAMSYTMRTNIKSVKKAQIVDNGTDTTKTGSYNYTPFDNFVFIESAYEVNAGRDNPQSPSSLQDASYAYVESLANTQQSGKFFVYDWYAKEYEDGTKDAESDGADAVVARTGFNDKGDREDSETMIFRCKYIKGAGGSTTIVPWQLRTPAIKAYYAPEQYGSANKATSIYVTALENVGKPGYGGIYSYWSSSTNYMSPCFCLGVHSLPEIR